MDVLNMQLESFSNIYFRYIWGLWYKISEQIIKSFVIIPATTVVGSFLFQINGIALYG